MMNVEAIDAPVKTNSTTDEVTPTRAEYKRKSPAAVAGAIWFTLADR
jgi:hypothetical protein